ncbi:T9SS type B sorting domain-containing protein [Flavobacterium urocaniciphilum]|uniref:Gliding motility-associated C-terminal domain-containing protein n=1 Tax=Flavobacterium urocaniciphilum TaxID=1299341 RepID=A0A1H9DZ44_9FLAO|nr:gliding motility-associated C-terminal domain-containing protein [Flavobacterium urocaniciphilum]SEQ18724.1 gliding motility-associated C-terminal domain-containing protein [Flavobacterium urocaniciphilum]
MKNNLLLVFTFFSFLLGYAQPANNTCTNAQSITPNGTCVSGTTVAATDTWNNVVGCQNGNNASNHPDVWYTFVSTGTQATFTNTAGTFVGTMELILVEGTCASTFTLVGSNCSASPQNVTFTGLTIGTTYYYTISNASGAGQTPGTFTTCVTTSSPPPISGQDCGTAAILCDNSTFGQGSSTAGSGAVFGNTSNENLSAFGCLMTDERQSKWYKFTVGCGGTIEFIIDPVVNTDDYDFAVYDITTSGCAITPGGGTVGGATQVVCNYSGCAGSTGVTSVANPCTTYGANDCGGPPGCQAGGIAAPPTLIAGHTYALIIDNFSLTNSGFNFTWTGGTATIGPDAMYTFTNPSCGVYNFTKTCNTGAFSTYLWTFGDGTTSTLQNPSHTYTTGGNYTISLEVTDALGCKKTESQTVTVAMPLIADTTANICSGNAFTVTPVNTLPDIVPPGTTYTWGAPVISPGGAITGGSAQAVPQTSISQTLTNITGSSATATYTVTASSGTAPAVCTDTFTIVVTVNSPLTTPTVTTTAATCFANGTATVSNYNATLTYTSTPAGLTVGAGGAISGFTCGTSYTITATNAALCSTTSASFTVQCQLAAPAVPTVSTTAATCFANGTATVSNYNATLTYTSTPAGLTVGAGGVVSGFTCGTSYTITATNAATCSATSASFTVQCQLVAPAVPTVSTTAATCFANGTATVSNYNAALTYTSTPAGISVGAGGLVSGFTCGTSYTITATNAATCSATSASFTVQCQLAAPAVPTVSTTAATCFANGTATVSNYSATITYTSTPAGLTVGAGGVVTGFTCGTSYTITATNAATCSATSASFTVQCQLITPAVPTVSTTAATCFANGTATVSNYSAALTYTSTPAGLSVGAGGTVTGFTCGTSYTITATNAATCSATSASFTVQCQLAAPAVPTVSTTAATCFANGTATVSNYNAALTYTSTPVGLSVGAGGVVTGFTCGTSYTITATNAATCSATSGSFTVQCQLISPAVPTVSTTAATCFANGTATVSNYSATLTYTSTPAGLSVGAGGTVSGFICGTSYTITATNAATCSATSASFTVQCQLAAPAVPAVSTTTATCLANGTATVSNYSPTLTYTSTPAGLTIGAGGVVSGFTCGTSYTITATNAATCSATSSSFTIECQLAAQPTPVVSTAAPTCFADGNSTITNYNASNTYTFTPTGPTVGAGGLISGMIIGTSYTATSTNAGCTSSSSSSFSNAAQLSGPAVPTISTTAATCIADGTATVSNYSATLTYTSTPAGLSVGAGGVVSGFTCGTSYTITATNAATCSATSASFTVQCQLAAPSVPTVSTTAATCFANGTATVSNYSATLTYTSTPAGLSVGAGGTVSGFTCGTSFTITATNAATCSATSVSFTVQCQLAAPAVPTVSTTAATCFADGTATVTNYSAALTYTSNPAGLSVSAGGVVSGFTCGTSYTITATNAATCSATSSSFTVQCQLVAPAIPTVSTTAATCFADGTATVSNYSAALTYTSTPAGLSVGTGGVVSGFTCGTSYTITATNAATCSATSASFTVQCQLVAPAVPTVSTTAATCFADGTATVSNYSATLTYTSTPAGLSVGAGGVVTGFTCGNSYTITATNAATCSATSASFTVQCQLVAPAVPTVSTTPATCFADGTATVTNYSAALTYTSTPAGLSVGAGGVVSGFTCGTSYTITATNATTCSATSVSFTVQCQLTAPAAPTVSTTPATCFADGTATVSNYSATLTYTSTPAGLSVGTGGVVSGFTCGTSYTITATNAATCSATSASFTVQCQLVAPAVPTVSTAAATCFADGTASVSNYNGALTYTSTPAGLSVGAGGVVSGFTCGTSYTITATNATTCSATSASFTVQCQLAAPAVPSVSTTAATCFANGSSTITNYSSSNTYNFTPSGPTVGAGGLISGMILGNSYTVISNNGSCTSNASVSFSNATMLSTPTIPTISTTAPTCTADGSSIITNYDNLLTYLFTPSGPTIGAGGIISGMTIGTSYIVVSNNGSCTSNASTSFSNASMLPSPIISFNSGCNGTNYEITASVDNGTATFEWYNSAGDMIGNQATIVITSMDTYEVRATVNSCTTIDYISTTGDLCEIPKGLSPNNDGLNDSWNLTGLNVERAEIFNRYGLEVYSKDKYVNEWKGFTNNGKELPSGTYYYVLTFSNGQVKTGWVYLNREN